MIEQRTPEWFEQRKGKITGSRVGAILGFNPWQTASDVLRAMVREYHNAPSEFTGNDATEWGTTNEPNAIFSYEVETDNKVVETGFHEFSDWIGASPDGLIGDDGLIEVKCPYFMRFGNKKFKSISEQAHYYAQIQLQLFATGRKWCDFYQWSPDEAKLEKVAYSEDFINEAMPKLSDFYDRYLEAIENPDQYLAPLEQDLSDDALANLAAIRYRDALAMLEDCKKALADAKQSLIDLAGGKKTTIDGLTIYEVEKKGAVYYAKAIKEYAPDANLEPFRGKASRYWVVK